MIDDLGIEDWYLETNRRGHFLAFDSSLAGAERLVDAVDATHLRVRAWGESFRPAGNGVSYDWYVLLKFRGSRDECLRVLDELFTAPGDNDDIGDAKFVGGEPPGTKSFWQRVVSLLPWVDDEPENGSSAGEPASQRSPEEDDDDDPSVRPIHKLVVNFDTGSWPTAGVLSEMGYKVGRYGLGPPTRRRILRTVLAVELVATTSETESYVRQWGPPNSKQRADKIERCLAGFANAARRRNADMSEAIADWEDDLEWFRAQRDR